MRRVKTYRQLVKRSWNARGTATGTAVASSVMVALHNLVTSTISESWQRSRQHFYCAGDVLAALPREFVADLGNAAGVALPAQGVPGLSGSTELVRCNR